MSKVTAYTENTAPSGDDVLYIVDSGAGTPTSKKVTLKNVLKSLSSAGGGATGSQGALLGLNASGEPDWLAEPSSGAILTYSTVTGIPAWSKPTSAAILTSDSAAGLSWLAPGTTGQYLKVGATAGELKWGTPGGGSSTINLPAAAWQPTGNPSSFASAQLAVCQSTAGVPSPRYNEWLFDATTREYIVTTFRCPPNYTGASAPTLTLQYYSTAAVASGTAWGCMVGGLPTSGGFAAWAFGATAALSTNTVPSSAFDLGVATITLTEGSSLMVAGNFVCLALFRDAAVAGDAADGDMHVVSAELAYS